MPLEDALVGAQRVARLFEGDDLLDEPLASVVGRLAGFGLRVDHELARLLLRFGVQPLHLILRALQRALGVFFGLFDRGVGRALREHERAPDRVGLVGLPVDRCGPARSGGLFARSASSAARRSATTARCSTSLHARLQLLDGDGDPFEEVVDLVGVVAPHLLVEFDLVDHLRRDVHEGRW